LELYYESGRLGDAERMHPSAGGEEASGSALPIAIFTKLLTIAGLWLCRVRTLDLIDLYISEFPLDQVAGKADFRVLF